MNDRGITLTKKSEYSVFFQSTWKLEKKSLIQKCRDCGSRQSAIVEIFAEANSVLKVITSAKILSRWLSRSKIYIQFSIFNTYFSTKLSFINKRYNLYVIETCLYVLQEVRSIIYFQQFIHPLTLCSGGNETSFVFRSYIVLSTKFCNLTF